LAYKKVQFQNWLYSEFLPVQKLPALEEKLFMYLVSLCGKAPLCWPGRSTIQKVLGISKTGYASTLLRRLSARGLIEIRPRKLKNQGRHRPPNEYWIKVYEVWTLIDGLKSTGGGNINLQGVDFNQVYTYLLNQKEPEGATPFGGSHEGIDMAGMNIGKGNGKKGPTVVAPPEEFDLALEKVQEMKASTDSPEKVLAKFRGKTGYGVGLSEQAKTDGAAVQFFIQMRASVSGGMEHSLGKAEKIHLSAVWKFFQTVTPDNKEGPLLNLYHLCKNWSYFRTYVAQIDKAKKVPNGPDLKFMFYNKELALEYGVNEWHASHKKAEEAMQSIANGSDPDEFN
jgi:hypothetical protein